VKSEENWPSICLITTFAQYSIDDSNCAKQKITSQILISVKYGRDLTVDRYDLHAQSCSSLAIGGVMAEGHTRTIRSAGNMFDLASEIIRHCTSAAISSL
jgi:hypothetical protein